MWEEPERKPIPMRVKQAVYERAKGKCERCRISLSMNEGDFHHIRDPTVTPRASSVRFICPTCHRVYGHRRASRTVSGLFDTSRESRVIRQSVTKLRGPKVKRRAIHDWLGNVIGYRKVRVGRKRKKAKKKRRRSSGSLWDIEL